MRTHGSEGEDFLPSICRDLGIPVSYTTGIYFSRYSRKNATVA